MKTDNTCPECDNWTTELINWVEKGKIQRRMCPECKKMFERVII